MWHVIERGDIITRLERNLKSGRLPNAYLIVGPPRVGKMTLALDIAAALNCGASEPACGQCPACVRILAGKHSDVQVLDLATGVKDRPRNEIGIDQVREIQHSASLPPFEGRYKVFIINEAEKLSAEAANCLLKTLEEPPPNTLFLLLTVNERLLPETVVSRCRRLELPPLPPSAVQSVLGSIPDLPAERRLLLANLSHGCPGWAVIAAGDETVLEQRKEQVDRLLSVVNGTMDERFAFAAGLSVQYGQYRVHIQSVLQTWLDWWHDVLLVKAGCAEAIVSVDYSARLKAMAMVYNISEICNIINDIRSAMEQIRLNANPRLVLEVLMLAVPRSTR